MKIAASALVLALAAVPAIMACTKAAPEGGAPPSAQPTATAVPAQVREAATLFLREYQAVNQEWDLLNADLDQWRAGLAACDRAAGQAALDGFAAAASRITQGARQLPRPAVARDLADQLVQAAEREEAALRRLRDGWQPADPAAYQAADAELAAAARLRQAAADGLSDLRVQVDPSVQPVVRDFAASLQAVNGSWNAMHQNYDSFRTLEDPEATDRLNEVIVGVSEVVSGVRGLPAAPATSPWAWELSEAIAAEEQAMRRLREPDAKDDAAALAAADAQVVAANAARSRVQRQVVSVLNTPEDNEGAVADFGEQYDALSQDWDRARLEYQRWRRGEGGCDGAKAMRDLDPLVLRAGALAGRVQGLPSTAILRPLSEPLYEAASRQAQALRTLRAGWRPYAAEAYKALDQERSSIADRRRQVAAAAQDLQARLGVSTP